MNLEPVNFIIRVLPRDQGLAIIVGIVLTN